MNKVIEYVCGDLSLYTENELKEIRKTWYGAIQLKDNTTLLQIFKHGPIRVDDLLDNSERDVLIELGYVTRCIVHCEVGYVTCLDTAVLLIEFIRLIKKRKDRRIAYASKESEHSVFTRCNSCGGWGVNTPFYYECGDCGSEDTIEYYPVGKDTIDV